jgi:hypothetical protein
MGNNVRYVSDIQCIKYITHTPVSKILTQFLISNSRAFKKRGDTLFVSDFELSNHTKLNELKSKFPNSFRFLNVGLEYFGVETYPYWMVLEVKDERKRVALSEIITLYFNEDKRLS